MPEQSTPGSAIKFNALTASHSDQIKHAQEKGTAPYTINRGLLARMEGEDVVQGYNELLPTFQGKALVDWVEVLRTDEQPVVDFADLGYGSGQCLLDMTDRYDFVQATGYGRSEYARLHNPEEHVHATYEQLMQQPHIQLIEGELPFGQEQLPHSSQSIIVANNVFQYLPRDIQEQVILGSFEALQPGGVALFNVLGITASEEIASVL